MPWSWVRAPLEPLIFVGTDPDFPTGTKERDICLVERKGGLPGDSSGPIQHPAWIPTGVVSSPDAELSYLIS